MNVGGGEAADQLVRMMLAGSEVVIRLSGSAMKNVLALSLALAKSHKRISGKVNLRKMLREARVLRQFPMTPEQYRQFQKLAKRQKLLVQAILHAQQREQRGGERSVWMRKAPLRRLAATRRSGRRGLCEFLQRRIRRPRARGPGQDGMSLSP